MAHDLPAEPVPPRPGLPRAIGVLNVVFGLVLLAWGAASLYALGPFLSRNTPLQIDPVLTQEVVYSLRRDMVERLRQEELAARDEPRKMELRRAREELEAVDTRLGDRIDFGRINRDLPWVSRFLWAENLSGPVLNVAMVVAGVGLVALREWGRRLAVWVAALKLVRLVGLCGLLSGAVVPALTGALAAFARTDFGKAFVRQAADQGGTSSLAGAAPSIRLDPEEFVRAASAVGHSYAVMCFALGAIYPLATLVVLSRPGAVTACRAGGRGPGDGEVGPNNVTR